MIDQRGLFFSQNNFSRTTVTKNIDHELDSEAFISRSKDGHEGVFTRVRKLSIRRLIVFIMSFKCALQRDLDRFYKSINNSEFSIREVTKGALSQARAKLNPWAFIRLNDVAVSTFYKEAAHYRWHGKRLLAVDGSRLTLPKHQTIIKEFDTYGFRPKADSHRSMALSSMLYDTLNHLTIDAQIAPLSVSERDLLLDHL